MKKIFYTLAAVSIFSVFFISCQSVPDAIPETEKSKEEKVTAVKPGQSNVTPTVENDDDEVIAEFDGVTITKRDKEIAKTEIAEVVKKLNEITAKKDYSRWTTFLSESYKREFSKPEVLKKTSENLPGSAKGLKLRNLKDYFDYVFVPSRQHGRVDDIRYISPSSVRVLKKEKKQELIFYNLEKIREKWKLVP